MNWQQLAEIAEAVAYQPRKENKMLHLKLALIKFAYALLALSLMACEQWGKVQDVEPNLNEATSAINEAFGERLFKQAPDDGPFDNDLIIQFQLAWKFVDASAVAECEENWNCTVSLSPSSQRSRATSLIVHELGHVMGLDHSDDPNNVMFWRAPTADVTTQAKQLFEACKANPKTCYIEKARYVVISEGAQ